MSKRKSTFGGDFPSSKRSKRPDGKYEPKRGKSSLSASTSVPNGGSMPRNAIIIRNILKDMGVEKFKPRVINQLQEFFHRHVRDILEDAYDYQHHAGRKDCMSPQDIKLAVQNNLAYSFLGPPPPEIIAARAKDVNRIPLENVAKAGIPPPASKFLLTTPNFELKADDISSDEEGT